MTTTIRANPNRLMEIYNLLTNGKETFKEFSKKNGDRSKEILNEYIIQKVKENGYDGKLNGDSIFWFVKGLTHSNLPQYLNQPPEPKPEKEFTEPPPPPKTIEPEKSNLREIIEKAPPNVPLRKLMPVSEQNVPLRKLVPPPEPKSNEYEPKRTTDPYFLNIQNSIRPHSKDDSFIQFMKINNENDQDRIVDGYIKMLNDSPTDWRINFEQLNDYGRKKLFPFLRKKFENEIGELAATEKYKLSYSVGGQWHSVPLNGKTYEELLKNLTEENFIYQIEKNPGWEYDLEGQRLPEFSLFSQIKFSILKHPKHKNTVDGGFFKYLLKPGCPKVLIDYLVRLQIFDSLINEKTKKIKEELNDCCFIYALQQTGNYSESLLNQIRLRIQNRYLSQSSINHLCEEFNIHLNLTYIDDNSVAQKQSVRSMDKGKRKTYMGIQKAEPERTHKFNVYQKHYFIEEKTPFTYYYIKNIEKLDEDKYNKDWITDHWTKGRSFITSSNLIRELFKKNYFIPINYSQEHLLHSIFYNEIDQDISNTTLEYKDEYCCKLIEPKTKIIKQVETSYWFCDFESDTSSKIHIPFLCCLHSLDGKIKKEFLGEKCNINLLKYLPTDSICYFHNLAYDIRMILQNNNQNIKILSSIIKGNQCFNMTLKFENKKITFKDSYPIFSCKLSNLPLMFNIPCEKEIFPYKYYTFERLRTNKGQINEAGKEEDKTWTEQDYQLFRSNINKIKGCRLNNNEFDMWKYALFYCHQDVRILRESFVKFRQGFIQDFKIDPFKYISISSLANDVFNHKVYYGHDLYSVGGIVRKFCSYAVYGGRCMTAYNKKWHITEKLADFDAVSLYPSAIHRLYTVQGKPVVISKTELNYEFLSKQGAYIVEILVTGIHKHYPFPLIVKKTKDGNLNDDKFDKPFKMIVDNIYLEDLIEFQKIDFELVRGYYWPGKREYHIQKEIQKIFEKRLEYKSQDNPLQNLYKLIMNSCYGKTIERPIEKDFKYINDQDTLDNYWIKNYNKIVEDIELQNNMHAVRILRPIDKHFNFSLLGIHVLSMSKRIMNEVMCLAFDIGCHIYYQDTDSMHIEINDLPKLQKAYKEKYNRELIGKYLGQFHSDFPTINGHKEMPESIESYFLMKKMYIDKLQDSTGEIDYMTRGKGLTEQSIKYAYKNEFDNDPMKLYKYLYEGNQQTFDLTKGQPCFQMNKNMTVSTLNEFKRRISTPYKEGKREKYFEY